MRSGAPLTMFIALAFCALGAHSQSSSNGRNEERPYSRTSQTRIEGAGSLALHPVVLAWIDEYGSRHPETRISYQALGSKAGLRLLLAGKTPFGATHIPVPADQLTSANCRFQQFPVTVTAVVPVYNLPDFQGLRFSSSTLADIFLGKITKWNAPGIMKTIRGSTCREWISRSSITSLKETSRRTLWQIISRRHLQISRRL
jgi:ABC-type phosphate transport system substrate-binding protein